MWYIVITVSMLLSSASAIEDSGYLDEEFTVNITNCLQIISSDGGGHLFIEFGQNCSTYVVKIQSKHETSIFNLKASILKLQNTTNSSVDESASTEQESINVNIYEHTVHQGRNYAKLLANWKFLNTTLTNHSYLSQTASVGIHVTPVGNWSDYHLIFFYEEIKYNLHEEIDSNDRGIINSPSSFEGRYRPNTVILYRLSGSSNWTSTLIMVDEVDIDTAAGEYFLIGPGTTPFKGPSPMFISQPKWNSSYYVDDGRAYIMFVSSSTQRQSTGFKMRWEHTGTKIFIDDNVPEDPYDALKSRLICFENASLALREFENPCADEVMKDFRKRFVEIVKRYAEEEKVGDRDIFEKLNASSIFLYPMQKDDPTESFLRVTVQVKYHIHKQRVSLLSWKQLGDVITKYQEEDVNNTVLGYKVGHCPPGLVYTSGMWMYLMYLSILAFGVFFLLIWAWRQKLFDTNFSFSPQKDKVDKNTNFSTVEPNLYEATVPKVVEIDDEGRRRTLVAENSVQNNQEEKNAGDILLTDMTAIPIAEEHGYGVKFSLPRSKRRPSLKDFVDDIHLHTESIEKNESEHVYDSVSSGRSTKETKL